MEPPRSCKAVVSPLAPELYKIQFTADAETHRMLRQLQKLMRHQIPNGDPAEIVKRGLELLLAHVEKQKFARVQRPRKQEGKLAAKAVEPNAPAAPGTPAAQGVPAAPGEAADSGAAAKSEVTKQATPAARPTKKRASRHIPAEVKRAVWQRDQGQCAFVSKRGRRCSERGRLEYHHVFPFGLGGEATASNISLRCRTHNAYEGDVIFGGAMKRSVGGTVRNGALTGAGAS